MRLVHHWTSQEQGSFHKRLNACLITLLLQLHTFQQQKFHVLLLPFQLQRLQLFRFDSSVLEFLPRMLIVFSLTMVCLIEASIFLPLFDVILFISSMLVQLHLCTFSLQYSLLIAHYISCLNYSWYKLTVSRSNIEYHSTRFNISEINLQNCDDHRVRSLV